MDAPTKNDQYAALVELYEMATKHDHGGAKVAGLFLLSLYNGVRFPFDLTELRRLDEWNFEKCIAVLYLDFRPAVEVHVHVATSLGLQVLQVQYELERLAHQWRLKGRCKVADLEHLRKRAYGGDS